MKNFNAGLGYVSVKLIPRTNPEFVNWFEGLEVENKIPTQKLHVTLMYDRSNRVFDDAGVKPEAMHLASVTGFRPMGEEGSKWAAVVAELESQDLEKRFRELSSIGFRHGHDTFVAHMSLTYGGDRTKILNAIKEYNKKNPIPSILSFGDESWKSTNV